MISHLSEMKIWTLFTVHGALCELVYLSVLGILKAAVYQTVQGICILVRWLGSRQMQTKEIEICLDSSLTCLHHAFCCVAWIPKSHAITHLHMVFPNSPLPFCPHLLSLEGNLRKHLSCYQGPRSCRSIIRLLTVTLSGLESLHDFE